MTARTKDRISAVVEVAFTIGTVIGVIAFAVFETTLNIPPIF